MPFILMLVLAAVYCVCNALEQEDLAKWVMVALYGTVVWLLWWLSMPLGVTIAGLSILGTSIHFYPQIKAWLFPPPPPPPKPVRVRPAPVTPVAPTRVSYPRRKRHSGPYGDASWAYWQEIDNNKKARLTPLDQSGKGWAQHYQNSILAGRYINPYAEPDEPGPIDLYFGNITHENLFLGYAGENNILTVAPPGSGKGTAAIIPTLLTSRESIFVLDIKGENFFITAPQRARMGQKIIVLNPFNIWGKELGAPTVMTHGFNPLQLLHPDQDDFIRRISAYAASLIPIEGNDPYWSRSARELVACIMAYICSDPGELKAKNNNLGRLIDILSLPLLDQGGFCEVMLNGMASNLPFIRNIASRYASSNSPTLKTTENVRQTAQAQLTFLNEPLIRKFLSTSDFEFADLRREPMTIYCMLPQDVNISYPNFSRLMVECFFSSFTIKLPAPDDNRVLVILDEQAQLKFMESIADAPALLRGYKVRIWSIYQNIGQMKQFYDKKWEEFISAAGMIQFMSPNDEDTAEYISKRVGNQTLTITTTSQSTNKSSNLGHSRDPNMPAWNAIKAENTGTSTGTSVTTNETQVAVPFLSRQDLYAMPTDRMLLFLNGLKYPLMAMRDSYLDQGETYLGALYAPHPVYDPGAFAKFKELARQCNLWPSYLSDQA